MTGQRPNSHQKGTRCVIMDAIFERLLSVIDKQQKIIDSITIKVIQIESMGGGGSASIEDFTTGSSYKRNTLVVDPTTETVYRVITDYISTSVEDDMANGYLKLVGFESSIVSFNHNPTQAEIDVLPDDTLVAIYSSTDEPYIPDSQ